MNIKILEKKNCLITGATGGIGEEISKQLATLSCNLFLTSTNKIKLEKLMIISPLKFFLRIYIKKKMLWN